MKRTASLVGGLLFLLIAGCNVPAWAAENRAGEIVYASGEVFVLRDGEMQAIQQGSEVFASDLVQTGPTGRAKLAMQDGSSIYLARNSRIRIEDYSVRNGSLFNGVLNMLLGKARFIVAHLKEKNASFSVRTQTAVLGVRGTNFIVSIEAPPEVADKISHAVTTVLLQDGSLAVKPLPDGKEILLKAGQVIVISDTGEVSVRTFTPEELQRYGLDVSDLQPGPVGPPTVDKPKIMVPVVVQSPKVQWGTIVIQSGGGMLDVAPTTTTIQVPVSVQPPVITQVPAQ